jgi:hypothetical protein
MSRFSEIAGRLIPAVCQTRSYNVKTTTVTPEEARAITETDRRDH